LEFVSCQLKAKYKERKNERKEKRTKARERKKKKSDRVSVFLKLARTILREQSFRLENREEKTKVLIPVPKNENGRIMMLSPNPITGRGRF